MMSRQVSRTLPFGERRRPHPALRFGAATLGSFAIIGVAWMFMTETVSQAVANAPRAEPTRDAWYVPADLPVTKASELDVARSVPVVVRLPTVAETPAVEPVRADFSHEVVADVLIVRAGPARTTEARFKLQAGTAVSVDNARDGWTEITTEDGRKGWVFARYLGLQTN